MDKLEVIKKEILIRVNISNQFFILVDGYSSDLDCFTNNNEVGLKSTLDFIGATVQKIHEKNNTEVELFKNSWRNILRIY